jgi:hypothetical protein
LRQTAEGSPQGEKKRIKIYADDAMDFLKIPSNPKLRSLLQIHYDWLGSPVALLGPRPAYYCHKKA